MNEATPAPVRLACIGHACMHTAPVRLMHRACMHAYGSGSARASAAQRRQVRGWRGAGAGQRRRQQGGRRDSVLTSQSGLVSDVCGPHGGALGSMAKGNRRSFREPEQ